MLIYDPRFNVLRVIGGNGVRLIFEITIFQVPSYVLISSRCTVVTFNDFASLRPKEYMIKKRLNFV
jgi:hypothetical protein